MKLQQLKYLLAIVDNGLNVTAAGDQVIDRARLIMREVDSIRSLSSSHFKEDGARPGLVANHSQIR